MDYKQELKQLMEDYYQLTVRYRETTVDAMMEIKKKRPFRKKDYSNHIANFRRHIKEAQALNVHGVSIPEEDGAAVELAELLDRSISSFILLCEANAEFYDLTDKKQYRSNRIALQDYTDSVSRLDGVLAGAMRELERLEDAYKQYCADNFPQK